MRLTKTLLLILILAPLGCASTSDSYSNTQLAVASLTLFPAPRTPARAPQDESLCAPIALYADPLLAEVLLAAAHEDDLAAAAGWIARHPRAQLGYEIRTGALHGVHWDPTVASLLAVPDLLLMMNAHPLWLRELARRFASQRSAIMDSIQRLRRRALLAGSMRSSSEQTVSTNGLIISIQFARPDELYVPYYLPRLVYGPWPWPRSAPYSLRPAAQAVFSGAAVAFGSPVNLTAVAWHWYRMDWQHHRIEPISS